jgi:hypothetical protein
MIDKLLALQPDAVDRVKAINRSEYDERRGELRSIERAMEPRGEKMSPQTLNAIKKKARVIKENQSAITPARSGASKFHKNFLAMNRWIDDYVEEGEEKKEHDPLKILDSEVTETAGDTKATVRLWHTGVGRGIEVTYPVKEGKKIVDPAWVLPGKGGSRLDKMTDYSIHADVSTYHTRGIITIKPECAVPSREHYGLKDRREGGQCATPAVVDSKCLDPSAIGTINFMECNVPPVLEAVNNFYKAANKVMDKIAGQIFDKLDVQIQHENAGHRDRMKELDKEIAGVIASRAK